MLFFIRYFKKTYSFYVNKSLYYQQLKLYFFLFIKYTYYNFVFIDSKNKLGNTLSKRFLICYGRNTLVKKTYKIQCANDESPYAQYPGFNFCR